MMTKMKTEGAMVMMPICALVIIIKEKNKEKSLKTEEISTALFERLILAWGLLLTFKLLT